jgi:SAM-dependent methyltransferase
VNDSYIYRSDELAEEKIRFLAQQCSKVLDIGKSSRRRYDYFQPTQIVTLDINQYDDYPDILDDICNTQHIAPASFDGLICLAVLEHVYNPLSAVTNMHAALKEGGYCFAYVPFLYRYHAASDLSYQDFFRYTRDGIAYLFRDFSEVTVYPSRGRVSTMLNLLDFWKYRVEKRFGHRVNKVLDNTIGRLIAGRTPELQASGYHVWAVK